MLQPFDGCAQTPPYITSSYKAVLSHFFQATMTSLAKDDLYIFSLGEEVVKSLSLLQFDESAAVVEPNEQPSSESAKDDSSSGENVIVDPKADTEKSKDYYKSDLHRLNLKRQVNGLPPLTEEEFENLLETQSLESISGSEESESEEEDESLKLNTIFEQLSTKDDDDERNVSHMNTNSPYILFQSPLVDQGKAFGMYKALFSKGALDSGNVVEEVTHMSSEPKKLGTSVLLMIGGGYFAGAVISHTPKSMKGLAPNHKISKQEQQVNVLQSKTFHRYTTRRKQGGSQSASDNSRGKANSAGSSIRRYNEQALQHEVRELLGSWKEYLQKADFIFIRANAVANRRALAGYEGAPLAADDKRIRNFPFTTKRATLSELKRAWIQLTYVQVVGLPKAKKVPLKRVDLSKSQRNTPSPAPELSESDKHTKEIIALLKKLKAPMMINYLKKNGLDVNFEFTPSNQHAHAPTPLHYASSQGLHHMVQVLLVNLKADPTILNAIGKTAAQMSSTPTVKKTFQIARHNLGEDYTDWSAAKVGPARSKEEVAKEEELEKKQQEAQNRRLIEEELAKKTEMEHKKPTFSSGGTLGGNKTIQSRPSETSELTEQQKTRLMREQRARAAEARMKMLLGK